MSILPSLDEHFSFFVVYLLLLFPSVFLSLHSRVPFLSSMIFGLSLCISFFHLFIFIFIFFGFQGK